MDKSTTDEHWDARAKTEEDANVVNIADVSQRKLETNFLLKHLDQSQSVLEAGCGNGFLTNIIRDKVKHVDAFDYAENMISRAKSEQGEKNNKFFHDNILSPRHWASQYDTIVCVRVLINLRNLDEQKLAVENMANSLHKGGKLILIEGYQDGFTGLNNLRDKSGLERLQPASINFYSLVDIMVEFLEMHFEIVDQFHTGSFDFLTRVVYPTLVGSQNATGHADFHKKVLRLCENFNPDDLQPLARLRGFLLAKKN